MVSPIYLREECVADYDQVTVEGYTGRSSNRECALHWVSGFEKCWKLIDRYRNRNVYYSRTSEAVYQMQGFGMEVAIVCGFLKQMLFEKSENESRRDGEWLRKPSLMSHVIKVNL